MRKLALFDFCETLVNFQTADAFVDYVRRKDGNSLMNFLEIILRVARKLKIITIINKFFPGNAVSKKIKLFQLRGFSNSKLNEMAKSYHKDMIRPNIIKPVIEEMNELARTNYEICLVSAGYSIYLKFFADDYHIKHIIANEIAFDKTGNRCFGKIVDKDCFSKEKVKRINTYFAEQNVNYSQSISYSDSISDLPMLMLTGEGVVISHENSQSWSNQHNFREIIW